MLKRNPRYYCLARTSLDYLFKFGEENDKAAFIDWVYEASKKLESGCVVDYPEYEMNEALFSAIEATIPEIQDGYERYMKRASGNRDKPETHQNINGQPLVNQWSTNGGIGSDQIGSDQNIDQTRSDHQIGSDQEGDHTEKDGISEGITIGSALLLDYRDVIEIHKIDLEGLTNLANEFGRDSVCKALEKLRNVPAGEIKRPLPYIRKTIQTARTNNKPPGCGGKTPAQLYEQRNHSKEDQEAFKRFYGPLLNAEGN